MSTELAEVSKPRWRGLGAWNLYFIVTLALFWAGYIRFNVYYNALFFAALTIPLPPLWLHRIRMIVSIPFGVALLYYQSWLPPFRRLLDQPEVWQFSNEYLLELLGRFINWEMVGLGFVMLVAYQFLNQWLRMTFFVTMTLCVVSLMELQLLRLQTFQWSGNISAAPVATQPQESGTQIAGGQTAQPKASLSLDQTLNNELAVFYEAEKNRHVSFDKAINSENDFDILFLNICSLSWADLEDVHMVDHALLQRMDIIFDNFNSATSYSGPAVTRLLRANCGQTAHEALYSEGVNTQCSLFDNLRSIGFKPDIALNHDGKFQGFIDNLLRENPGSEPLIPTDLRPAMRGFDDSPIWGDYATLDLWLNGRIQGGATQTPSALLYNTISLHDGNREATEDGGSRSASYESRARKMLDELEMFMEELQRSGRKVMVVLIPEHGGALRGDRMQFSGMREIPTPEITQVPVGVRFFGLKAQLPDSPLHVIQPTSYFALAELISRVTTQNIFGKASVDWEALVNDLPQTAAISENEGVVMMKHEGTPYVRIQGGGWTRYEP